MRIIGRLERQDIIFQLICNTRMTEEALEKMSNEDLIELYRVKVDKEDWTENAN